MKGDTMAKSQKRSNRETRKPKQVKKPSVAPAVGAAGSADPIRSAFAANRIKGKKSHA